MEEITGRVFSILKEFDRMVNNPDDSFLRETIRIQLEELGLIRFFVFICPKFNPKALFGPKPEEYMPVEASRGDLFEPRVPKIKEMADWLKLIGVPVELNCIIGDNDAENYIFPFLPEIKIDPVIFLQRQKLYEKSFTARVRKLLGKNCIAWSLSVSGIGLDETESNISAEEIIRELQFFDWLFSREGPYHGMLKFPDKTLKEMVRLKFGLYGAQGKFLEELAGILLQTEGPGVWLQRTMMLRSAGNRAVPAIYPWIRQEELQGGNNG